MRAAYYGVRWRRRIRFQAAASSAEERSPRRRRRGMTAIRSTLQPRRATLALALARFCVTHRARASVLVCCGGPRWSAPKTAAS